jgi:hypothetical protein
VYTLGLNAYHGDSAACLVKDGALVAAAEEERFRRIKHWAGFPSQAIAYCLEEAGITLDRVDHVAVNQDSNANLWQKVRFTVAKRPDLSAVDGRGYTLMHHALAADETRDEAARLVREAGFDVPRWRASLVKEFASLPNLDALPGGSRKPPSTAPPAAARSSSSGRTGLLPLSAPPRTRSPSARRSGRIRHGCR